MITFTDATAEHLPDVDRTMRAIALLDGDTLVGIAGIYLDGPRMVMHAKCAPQVWADKRIVVKAWRRLLEIARARALPIHATPDPAIKASTRFLLHLGFRPLAGEIYQWEGA